MISRLSIVLSIAFMMSPYLYSMSLIKLQNINYDGSLHTVTYFVDAHYLQSRGTNSLIKSPFPHRVIVQPQSVSISTPMKRNLIQAVEYNDLEANVIYSQETAYEHGIWIFADPLRLGDYVVVNADHKNFNLLAAIFLLQNGGNGDVASYLIAAMQFYRGNITNFMSAGAFDGRMKFVCRHYASYALPFFARILASVDGAVHGTIRLIDAHFLDESLRSVEDGHAWNLITITSNTLAQEYWLVDTLQANLVKIDPDVAIDDLTVIHLDHETKAFPLREIPRVADYVRETKEKFHIGARAKRMLFDDFIVDDVDTETLAAEHFSQNYYVSHQNI